MSIRRSGGWSERDIAVSRAATVDDYVAMLTRFTNDDLHDVHAAVHAMGSESARRNARIDGAVCSGLPHRCEQKFDESLCATEPVRSLSGSPVAR
ncbi:hypothetical protein PSAC2689_180060 [Paraburkholderia sacchari]